MKKFIRKSVVTVLAVLLVVIQMPFTVFAATTVDFALNRTVTYSGVERNGSGNPYPQFGGENVVDGKTTTRWSAEQLDLQWLIVDLEGAREIDKLQINFFREPLEYTIEVSEDGVNYETLLDVSENPMINVENVRSFPFATTKTIRYIKINQTQMFINSLNGNLYGGSIFQILAYGELDTSGLQVAIDEAEKITNLENYTEATKNELIAALANAKDVLDTALTQEQIDAAEMRLLEALDNLKTNLDISELEAEVNAPLLEADYTTKSYAAYKEAITEGTELLQSGNATQEEINAMVDKIKNSKNGLIEKIKEEELEQLISEVEGLNGSDYTTDSWEELQDQLKDAKDALLNASNQDELETAKNNLLTAKNGLKNKVNVSELEMEVNFPLLEKDYTTKSYAAYKEAITEGTELLQSGNATQEEINAMVDKIKNSKKDLIEKIKEEELEQLINEVEGLNGSDYTTDSWEELQDQLKDAKDALLNASNQDELETAKNNLLTAKNGLKKKVDVSELEAETNTPLFEGDYNAKSYAAYKQAIIEGKELLENGNATQEEINAMVDKIKNSKNGLIEKAKENELEQLINKLEGLDKSKYTEASWNELQKQLADAKDALLNASNQQELQTALNNLHTANNQLVIKGSVITGTEDTNNNTTNSESTNAEVSTGDLTNIKVISLLFVVSAALLVWFKEKKEMQ